MTTRFFLLLLSLLGLGPTVAKGAAVLFNSADVATAGSVRAAWLAAIGTTALNLVDFETSFVDGQNISGVSGLFPGGLVISDTSVSAAAIIRTGAGVINGSDPVGTFSVTQNELPFLTLDFSAAPVDAVGLRDIDHAGVTGTIYFVGGASQAFALDGTTGTPGDSAEFLGISRNDMPGILRVELDASGDGLWGIDNIEYSAVPEPSTLAMAALGGSMLLLAAWARRRRSSITSSS